MVISSEVKVKAEPQLSVAVAIANSGVAGHEIVVSSGSGAITGAIESITLIVCEVEDELLQASVNVQVLVTTNELGHSPWAILSIPSTVISPLQLSVAVSEIIGGTSVAQSTVWFEGAIGAIGAVLSCTLKVADVDEKFPQASFAVKITVTAAEQSFESALKVLDQVTSEQLSVAVAPPLFANQSAMEFRFPWPSHSTVIFDAVTLIVGAVVSSMVILWVNTSEILPQSSFTVHVLV